MSFNPKDFRVARVDFYLPGQKGLRKTPVERHFAVRPGNTTVPTHGCIVDGRVYFFGLDERGIPFSLIKHRKLRLSDEELPRFGMGETPIQAIRELLKKEGGING